MLSLWGIRYILLSLWGIVTLLSLFRLAGDMLGHASDMLGHGCVRWIHVWLQLLQSTP